VKSLHQLGSPRGKDIDTNITLSILRGEEACPTTPSRRLSPLSKKIHAGELVSFGDIYLKEREKEETYRLLLAWPVGKRGRRAT